MSSRCLACYEALETSEAYHSSCVKKIFGTSWVPVLDFVQKDFYLLAQKMAGQMSISGAQPKITVELNEKDKKIELLPRGGSYILKPQNQNYAHLPENEDLCMHLSKVYEIETAKHALIKTAEGEFAYLVKRFDLSSQGNKFPVEDFGQILGVASERKYSGSYEKIGKAILQHCTHPYLELTRFFERLLFCFVIGNGDMHLKNFSLITDAEQIVALSPAYDLLSSKLVIPSEDDLPLSLLGKRNKIKGQSFLIFGEGLGLAPKAMQNSIHRLLELQSTFEAWIQKSFLPQEQQKKFAKILIERMGRFSKISG